MKLNALVLALMLFFASACATFSGNSGHSLNEFTTESLHAVAARYVAASLEKAQDGVTGQIDHCSLFKSTKSGYCTIRINIQEKKSLVGEVIFLLKFKFADGFQWKKVDEQIVAVSEA